MNKKLIKKLFPNLKKIKSHKHLQMFGKVLNEPNLWHLNRYSVATAFSIGTFFAFIPLPFQMFIAAALAIWVRANLPISVALVWLTNPITMPPIFYFAFQVGAFILGREPQGFNFELSFSWLTHGLQLIWAPFLLGCLVCGTICALLSNLLIRLLWRYSVIKNWQARRDRRKRLL
jgi:uncharacterized protein (DUF2062 family)